MFFEIFSIVGRIPLGSSHKTLLDDNVNMSIAVHNEDNPTKFCFLVGAGGTGKTTLTDMFASSEGGPSVGKINEVARTIMKEHGISRADLSDDTLFLGLQKRIARRQLAEERKYEASEKSVVISDRSVIDAVVYSILRLPCGGEAPHVQASEKDLIFNRLSELVGSDDCACELLHRYRASMIVLVHPFNDDPSIDDQVRILMSSAELDEFTSTCKRVLKLFDIAFLDLDERSKTGRLAILQDAIRSKTNSIS